MKINKEKLEEAVKTLLVQEMDVIKEILLNIAQCPNCHSCQALVLSLINLVE